MFPDVNNMLNISPHSFPKAKFIGICEMNADSSFLVHHFLSLFVKQNCNVVFLSTCQSFNHYNNVGNKIGTNLTLAKDNNKLIFIDGLRSFGLSMSNILDGAEKPVFVNPVGDIDTNLLYKMLVEKVQTVARQNVDSPNTVLVIDNMSVLLDLGVSPENLMAFVHYLSHYVVEELNGCLVLGMNNDTGEEDEDGNILWRFIQHSCTLALEVRGLESGYCRDVHGQLRATWPSTNGEVSRETTEVKSSQFKLTDKTCQLFASGMSSAVL